MGGPMVNEEDERVADLLKVLEISRQLAATTDLVELLGKIEQAALDVLECERATVCVYDRETDELFARVATGITELRFPAGQGIAGECFRTGKVINVPDAYADQRFNRAIDQQTGFRTRNMLTCPLLSHKQQPVGVLQVLNKTDGAFDAWDEDLAQTFSAQCGVAFERHNLLNEFAQKQKLERELNMARHIQEGLLPTSALCQGGFELVGWNKPADQTGGDFFDYQSLDNGLISVAIADVTGHGMGPALVAAECSALLRATFSFSPQLAVGVNSVNRLLSARLPDDRFVTLFFGLLDPAKNELSYISAGHGPLIMVRGESGEIEKLGVHGPPMGIAPDWPYEAPNHIHFNSGDFLFLLTDGFFESPNLAREQFGMTRLQELLQSSYQLPSADLIHHVYANLLRYCEGAKQEDDLTAVMVKKL